MYCDSLLYSSLLENRILDMLFPNRRIGLLEIRKHVLNLFWIRPINRLSIIFDVFFVFMTLFMCTPEVSSVIDLISSIFIDFCWEFTKDMHTFERNCAELWPMYSMFFNEYQELFREFSLCMRVPVGNLEIMARKVDGNKFPKGLKVASFSSVCWVLFHGVFFDWC